MDRFQDKVAVVTGAASGFGEAIASRFAAEGAAVVVADIDDAGAKRVVSAIETAGGRAVFAHTDVSISDDVKRMIDRAQELQLARAEVIPERRARGDGIRGVVGETHRRADEVEPGVGR